MKIFLAIEIENAKTLKELLESCLICSNAERRERHMLISEDAIPAIEKVSKDLQIHIDACQHWEDVAHRNRRKY